ncbi:AN1-type zinc finger protein 1 [Nasonia vitripennis]|uniref:AN1-type domain-containing protein n=1 Tax=Nasonia vitripennis TaxID=7425 RepID=A0A7M7R3C5_NASVI|nr:AN1-type zinc finger protein 1 [Nasonia vitripennis]XP_032457859.1 AN1-type zinc finger protein 1 [Nasonia vitripennis]XP_032457860.1 AN1-type zinc finger protein 1 [Nasonia vitripennis]XP_032457861.1 AN1-type zinc finger protein 1 [Nasonia vitripennis]
MEFPNTGVQCFIKECNQLDFLPLDCKYCKNIFCKNHFNTTSHSCPQLAENVAENTGKANLFHCSQMQCTTKSAVEMTCVKCKKNFCLIHRFHDCFEENQDTRQSELERWSKPKEVFLETKKIVDTELTNKLKKSKNSALAIKVQLMKLKNKSVGPSIVPVGDRCYFSVHPPINNGSKIFDGSRGAYVSVNWSIGKVIDSISDSLNIPNSNNLANVQKLRMFHYLNGNIVTNQMDIILSELFRIGILVDGQDIILEYSTNDRVDFSLYK